VLTVFMMISPPRGKRTVSGRSPFCCGEPGTCQLILGNIFYLHSRLLERATPFTAWAVDLLLALSIHRTRPEYLSLTSNHLISIRRGNISSLSATVSKMGSSQLVETLVIGLPEFRSKTQLRLPFGISPGLALSLSAPYQELQSLSLVWNPQLDSSYRETCSEGTELNNGRAAQPLSVSDQGCMLFGSTDAGSLRAAERIVCNKKEKRDILSHRASELDAFAEKRIECREPLNGGTIVEQALA